MLTWGRVKKENKYNLVLNPQTAKLSANDLIPESHVEGFRLEGKAYYSTGSEAVKQAIIRDTVELNAPIINEVTQSPNT